MTHRPSGENGYPVLNLPMKAMQTLREGAIFYIDPVLQCPRSSSQPAWLDVFSRGWYKGGGYGYGEQ